MHTVYLLYSIIHTVIVLCKCLRVINFGVYHHFLFPNIDDYLLAPVVSISLLVRVRPLNRLKFRMLIVVFVKRSQSTRRKLLLEIINFKKASTWNQNLFRQDKPGLALIVRERKKEKVIDRGTPSLFIER